LNYSGILPLRLILDHLPNEGAPLTSHDLSQNLTPEWSRRGPTNLYYQAMTTRAPVDLAKALWVAYHRHVEIAVTENLICRYVKQRTSTTTASALDSSIRDQPS
jgi:hypothetical protein